MNEKNNERKFDYSSLFHRLSHYFIINTIFWPFYFFRYKIKIIGAENIPTDNLPFLFISNHYSYEDPPLLSLALRRPIAYIAKKELFAEKWLGPTINFLGAIPIDRNKTGLSTIKTIKEALKNNWLVGIFIEGTRNLSRTEMTKLEEGTAFIARVTGKTRVLPMALRGGEKVFDKLEIHIGKIIEFQSDLSAEEMTLIYGQKVAELAGLELQLKPKN